MNNYDDMFGQIFGEGFSKGFTETKEEITNKYIKGLITKEEYIRRMKNAR